jgi:hypothetical protein
VFCNLFLTSDEIILFAPFDPQNVNTRQNNIRQNSIGQTFNILNKLISGTFYSWKYNLHIIFPFFQEAIVSKIPNCKILLIICFAKEL